MQSGFSALELWGVTSPTEDSSPGGLHQNRASDANPTFVGFASCMQPCIFCGVETSTIVLVISEAIFLSGCFDFSLHGSTEHACEQY